MNNSSVDVAVCANAAGQQWPLALESSDLALQVRTVEFTRGSGQDEPRWFLTASLCVTRHPQAESNEQGSKGLAASKGKFDSASAIWSTLSATLQLLPRGRVANSVQQLICFWHCLAAGAACSD
jgi:hypothetical protein